MVTIAIVIMLAVAGLVALIAVGGEVASTVESGPLDAVEVPGIPDSTPGATAAQGLEPGSLIRRAELSEAITAFRAEELGAVVTLRVAAERVDVQLKSSDGRLSSVQVLPGAQVRVLHTTGPSFGSVPTLGADDVDPGAPQRLVRAVLERTQKKAGQVDYLVLMGLGQPTWGLFFKDGTHYQGDADGRILRKVS